MTSVWRRRSNPLRLSKGMDRYPLVGAHHSIEGGHDRAVERAVRVGCLCLQIFTKNNLRWDGKPLTKEGALAFRRAVTKAGLEPVVAHSCYLINLASPDDTIYERSIAAFEDELDRCKRLGVKAIITHPGSHTGSGAQAGVRRIVDATNRLLKGSRDVSILMETTAGEGTSIGGTFEELAAILNGVRARTRIGVCFDTCHTFAAGYDLRSLKKYRDTMKHFDGVIGIERLRAFHLNDCQGKLGSHVDRHEQIGRGRLGDGAFRNLLRDGRFREIPKLLETRKRQDGRSDWDEINLAKLRKLARPRR